MPKMPKRPEELTCDCQCPVEDLSPLSASEDIKLKVIEKKLRDELSVKFIEKNKLKTINDESLIITDLNRKNIAIKSIDRIEGPISISALKYKYVIYFNFGDPYEIIIEKSEPGSHVSVSETGTPTETEQAQYITIDGKTWKIVGNVYTAGDGLLLSNNKFAVDYTKVAKKSEFDSLKAEVEGVIVPEVEQIQQDITVIQGDITEIRTDVEDLDTRVEDLKEEIEDPESGLAKKIAALEARLDTAEERMTEIEARIAAIKLENIPGTLNGGEIV